jgi:uncharacterized protein (TIGR00369 family)
MASAILELVARDKQALVAHVPHSVRLGITVLDVKPNECWMKVRYDESLVGNVETRVVAGGVITALLDQACGSSVIVSLQELVSIATLDLRIDYMKPATPGLDIIGYSHCYKVTRNVAFTRGVAYHTGPDEPIANVVGTFMLGANRAQPALRNAFTS